MLKVYGASDDLIEFEGDVCEEISRPGWNNDYEGDFLAFSDGTVVKVFYDEDGLWRFTLMFKGNLFNRIEQGNTDDDINDILYFDDGVKWCVCGEHIAK